MKPNGGVAVGEPKAHPLISVDQYLAIERNAVNRSEYLDGVVYSMAGESIAHGDICVNLVVTLGTQLRGKPCRVLAKDIKVRSGPRPDAGHGTKGLFSYPDIVVICGDPEPFDDKQDIIVNPKVIIEVLSPTTESFDRGRKFERYQEWNPTLQDYLLVSQDEPRITHYRRQSVQSWTYQQYTRLTERFLIETIDCVIPLADVYERVEFGSNNPS
jgi:Uma2 family endonuclease